MSPKNKIYIISIIFGLIVVILIVLFIYPLFKAIRNNSQELFSTKRELILFKDQIREIENFEEVYENYQPNLAKIDQLFVDPQNPTDFIQFLEKIAFDSRVSMEISPLILSKEKEETEFWLSVTSQISSKGSFSNFLRFFEKLEASPYLIEAQNLVLRKLNERELEIEGYSLGDIKVICLIKVFTR